MAAKGKRASSTDSAPIIQEAVYYVRVSSKEQEEEGFSIPAQVAAAKEYAATHSLRLVQEFVDVESAKKSGRRQFELMCSFLKKSRGCKVIIVEKTDRLYRNLRDWVELDNLMNEHDLEVHLYKEGSILTKDSRSHEKFIHGIKVLMAKNFIDNLSEEVKKGMLERARQGHYPGLAPVGYINNPASKRLDLDEERAPIIRRLFELYATAEYSVDDLRKVAKQAGLTSNTKTPQPLARSGVNRLLNNPIYHGEFDWKGRRYQGSHVPIISKPLYEKVQAVMHGRKGGIYQDREFAYTGLIRCGHCGCAVTAQIQKERYVYYHCTGNKGKCPEKKYVREEVIDRQLGEILRNIQMDERIYQTLRQALKDSLSDEQAFLKQNLANLQAQETKLLKRLQGFYLDKVDGVINSDVYFQLKAECEAELEEVRSQIAANQKADARYLDFGVRLLELAQTAYQSYSRRTNVEKRQLLNFVLSNCLLQGGQLIPTYREPFDVLASAGDVLQKRESPDLSRSELSRIRGG